MIFKDNKQYERPQVLAEVPFSDPGETRITLTFLPLGDPAADMLGYALDPFPWTPSERWTRWHAWAHARPADESGRGQYAIFAASRVNIRPVLRPSAD